MTALLAFIKRREAARLRYRLRWEVEFFEDGHVESERFMSDGTVFDASALVRLLDFGESAGASGRD
jgi:hypothetical protein